MMAGEMVGWENSLGFSPYNDRFRTYRKNMARIIGSKRAAAKYDRLQEAEVAHFLLHVLDDPERFMDHIRKEAGSVILKIAYGYTAEPSKEDILIKMAGQAMDDVTAAGVPGAFLVDILPLLRYVPDWVPGANFKRLAKKWSSELDDLTEKPYAFVKHQHASGKQDNSFVSRLLEVGDSTEEARFTTKWSALSLYAAGADTKKAQEEIDGVIGNERLPNCSDRQSLPYVNAIVNEVLRWHPVAPMGLPHTSTVDDVFEGYFVPKDALIMPNIWYFAHDPEVHHEPMRFNPERFLSTDGNQPEQDPHMYTFGFGRRVCPGRVLADNALFLNIAQSLAVLHIRKDENGAQPELLFTPGMISHPEPFKAAITPRSPHHEQLIRSLEQEYPWEQSDGHIIENMQRQAS
ncbi:cytochrome P450 [Fusarium oxysporum Fo47]|uniref:cytochrome P450 n=1 Tax=Fusarium oxysporum Fo47 TaxID=660027 RepID=UPI002869A120|nr:cytochrome P450 [Fusarium oxysporum Fo47]QKD59379.2 cytochrome P450 [Fusarium oxysporum Fo47]